MTLLAAMPWRKIGLGLLKANAWLLATLKPLGALGLLIIAMLDSSTIPMPLDAIVVEYVVRDHAKFLVYCFAAAVGAAAGGLLPYYLGRAGGELFLLKRINRARYEKLRDRFEKQEFLAIMIPAMMPPPFPIKVFELAAGVFEMKPLWFFSAVLAGRFLRFTIVSVIIMVYGPAIFRSMLRTLHRHQELTLIAAGIFVVAVLVYVARKVFDRRRGTPLPMEEL